MAGATFEFPIPLSPTQSMGPFFDHVVESPSSSTGPFFDHVVDTIPTMSLGPMFDHDVSSFEGATGPLYSMAVTEVRERAISNTYTHIISEFREHSIGTNFSFTIPENFEGLIRNYQITQGTITADRLVDIPVEVLASRYAVDMTVTQEFPLYEVPSNKLCIVLGMMFDATSANSVTSFPVVSLGINTSSGIFESETMEEFDALGDTWSNWLVFSSSRAATPAETIVLGITGATATQLVADVHLIGFLV